MGNKLGLRKTIKCMSFLICWSNLSQLTMAIWLNLPPFGTKCVSEEIQSNVVVLADYYVISDDQAAQQPTISVKVNSPQESGVYFNEKTTHGQFAFTTHEAGNYLACFWVDSYNNNSPKRPDVSVNLDWRIGIAAKDWDSIAKKENIEGVQLELRKIEGAIEAVHENLLHLRSRESEMRVLSDRTNSRVAVYSTMSLALCIAVSLLQLFYLKRYFLKKKLI